LFIPSKIFIWGSRRQLAPFFGRSVKTVNHESRLKIWSKCLKWRLVPKWDEFNIDFSIDVSMVSGPNLVLTPLKRASKIQISSVVPGPPSKFFFGEHVLQPASIWMHAAYRCAHGAFFVFLVLALGYGSYDSHDSYEPLNTDATHIPPKMHACARNGSCNESVK
jgi:hypothetical protein